MKTGVQIPRGDDTVKVELTLKEVMALAGIKFHGDRHIEASARKKLNHVLDDEYVETCRPLN